MHGATSSDNRNRAPPSRVAAVLEPALCSGVIAIVFSARARGVAAGKESCDGGRGARATSVLVVDHRNPRGVASVRPGRDYWALVARFRSGCAVHRESTGVCGRWQAVFYQRVRRCQLRAACTRRDAHFWCPGSRTAGTAGIAVSRAAGSGAGSAGRAVARTGRNFHDRRCLANRVT